LVGPVIAARVLDLGPGGARIETARALRVGAPYTFTLELPGASRRLRGRVRWCRLVGTTQVAADERVPIYRAGIVWRAEHLRPITGEPRR
jgi:hypothetical protein